MNKLILLLLIIVIILINSIDGLKSTTIECLNDQGESVDWWVIQKQPVVSSMPADTKYKLGLGYLYADSKNPTWKIPTNTLNDTNSLSHTLNLIYSNKESNDLAWFMYNDQPPTDEADSEYAHSKGVVAFDSTQGFWLIHSVPRFPHDPNHEDYYFPKNEVNNGQSFLCVTYKASSSFADIANKIFINRPFIYAYNLPSKINLPQLSLIQQTIKGEFDDSPRTDSTILSSIGGNSFQVFAKNAAWDKDLYEDLIQSTLKQNMVVTSWRLGSKASVMPTYCSGGNFTYDSINTLTFSFDDPTEGTVNWKYTKDHSKYALSIHEADYYICIGDVNRMFTQFKRGGGSACFINKSLWQSYANFIETIDTNCPGDTSLDL
ncbi:hypothetical protein ACTFIW_008704 [Dictyostelium discoideum]